MSIPDHARALLAEATRADERRMLVIVGGRADADRAVSTLVEAEILTQSWVYVGTADGPWNRVDPVRANRVLGTTVDGLVIDAIDGLRPNTIGQTVGAVAGGGLIVLLLDDLDAWIGGPLASDDRYAVYPYEAVDVGSRFRERFVETLFDHRGVSVVDAETGAIRSSGTIDARPARRSVPPTGTAGAVFPARLFDRCLTTDQRRVLEVLETLASEESVVVIEAHRGRGKSSAAGLAAAGLALAGKSVAITGPGFQSVRPGFERAAEALDAAIEDDGPGGAAIVRSNGETIAYVPPAEVETLDAVDVVIVDEAAALPVDRLARTLDLDRPVAFLTTVHGYEGTGRGFALRFNQRLDRLDRPVHRERMREPIRFAPGDPIETWHFRALLLDANPPPQSVVAEATPTNVTYERIDREELVEDEALLRQLFGLLVLAHYRTEPDDLVRLLDAPNVSIRLLSLKGHPVSVALLAEEGGLSTAWRDRVYAGEPIRGHMIPDLLTTQLRDQQSGVLDGVRYLRIATHPAVTSRGLGSRLVDEIHQELGNTVDWIGAGFGMTPRLIRFWDTNGFDVVHIGTSRNPRSGEHSAVMLQPTTPAGEQLRDRHAQRLATRLEGQLTDALDELAPSTLATACRSIPTAAEVDLHPWVWDVIESTPNGPGQVSTAPHGFRQLVLAGLIDGPPDLLEVTQRDLLVERVLQGHTWARILATHDLTRGDARRSLQDGIARLLSWYDR